MATELKDLNLEPRLESMFQEIDQKLGSLVSDKEAFCEFIDDLDNIYDINSKVEELINSGYSEDYITEQLGKGYMFLMEKYQLEKL